ncbi:SIMPL domain-containing protein [Streptomyces sp. NPDC088745]|uniref:SIMPL domain-containing protein n=1 Tax=Streptomyces sp. NPDC088745 TaxID=3365884 RepID=UPI003805CEE6
MTTDTPTPAAPYGTPDAPRVAVRGEARLEVDPDLARISVTVSARGTDRRTALDDLTRRNAAVLDLIKTYGEAVEKLETGSFSINPELTRKGRTENIRAYHGRVHLTAELADFTALGELTTRLSDLELTRVDGPWWKLRPTSPAYAQARTQAVHEAVARARAYAEALGTHLVALLELADDGSENSPMDMTIGYGGGPMMRGAAAPESAPALDLEPQRQTVHAHVNARFTMAPPQL